MKCMVPGCEKEAAFRLDHLRLSPPDPKWEGPAKVTIGGKLGGPNAVCCAEHVEEMKKIWSSDRNLRQLQDMTENQLGFRPAFDASRTEFGFEEIV